MESVANSAKADGWALRIGGGATVPATYVQAQSRPAFFDALHRLIPASSQALTGSDANQVEQCWQDARESAVRALKDTGREDDIYLAKLQLHPLCAAYRGRIEFIEQWQSKYNLPDDGVKDYFGATLWMAWAMAQRGEEYISPIDDSWNIETDVRDGLYSMHDVHDMVRRFRFTPDHRLVSRPVYLDHLRLSEDGIWEDDGWFGTFDARTETIETATDRLLESLRPRMRRALEIFYDEDRVLNGAVAPVTFSSSKAFEWLVRYQVLTEDMDEIADAAGVTTQAVHKQVHKAKNAIELTLRQRSKPGPKPGTSPNRVR